MGKRRIGIVDADLISRKRHRFPNLASMKISGYHKSIGDDVTLITNWDELVSVEYIYIYIKSIYRYRGSFVGSGIA